VKTLWLSIFVSLGIHALVMSLETSWLKISAPTRPHPDMITISLQTLPHKRSQRAETLEKIPPVSEKKADLPEKIKARPPKPVMSRTLPRPAVQKLAATPVLPPAMANPQPTVIDEPEVNEETVYEQKIKPKRSLKKLTKKRPKKAYQEKLAPIKKPPEHRPVARADVSDQKLVAVQPVKSRSETAKTRKSSEHVTGPAKPTGRKTAPHRESTMLAAKGDTSAMADLVMARPLYRKSPPPKYPRRARRKGYEGIVMLEVLVDESGRVKDLKVAKSSGFKILDKSALATVKKWRFEPGTRNGKATRMWVSIPIRFKLTVSRE
jgi:protein TonB